MEHLAKLTDKDVFPNTSFKTPTQWEERKTVKILLINPKGELALVTNPIHKQYLLPGGGVNGEEDIMDAADRESQEEVGYTIQRPKIFGITEEYRARDGKHYTTYGVIADVEQKVSSDLRTENEKSVGLNVKWTPSNQAQKIFETQLEILRKGDVPFYNTGFNIVRDKLFINTAQSLGLFIDHP